MRWFILLLALFHPSVGISHDIWLETETAACSPGDSVQISLKSGHYFPETSYRVKSSLISASRLRIRDTSMEIFLQPESKQYMGMIEIKSPGNYLAEVEFERAAAGLKIGWAQALIQCSNQSTFKFSPRAYGLDILPLKTYAGEDGDTSMRFKILRDGMGLETEVVVLHEKTGSLYMKSDSDGLLILPVKQSGLYLISIRIDGQFCTLSFRVNA